MHRLIKRAGKSLIRLVSESTYESIRAYRARQFSERYEIEQGCDQLTRDCIEVHGGPTVQAGPFKGLKFPPIAHHRHLAPKLIGSYEHFLHTAIDRCIDRHESSPYEQIINVGSAEGYFTVGLARRLPNAEVVAFDTDPWARKVTQEMATLNGCPNVRVEGACSIGWLQENLRAPALIVSDCEGFEFRLINPDAVDFSRCDLVIEVHPDKRLPTSNFHINRFTTTHEVETYDWVAPHPEHWAGHLHQSKREQAVCEYRTDQESQYWLVTFYKSD